MAAETMIKSGFLFVPPSTWIHSLLNKPWTRKQCVLYPASRQGVKRLEIFDLTPSLRRKEPAATIIPLNDCLKIAQERRKDRDFVFSVVTRSETYLFSVSSIQELLEWVDALQRVAFPDPASPSSTKPAPSASALTVPSPADRHSSADLIHDTLCDDNALYGPLETRRTFPVTIEPNETATRLGLHGHYQLEISQSAVILKTVHDGSVCYSWLFQDIRRYGKTRGSFSFESGRSSETGVGSFVFRTPSGLEVQAQLVRMMDLYQARRRSAGLEAAAAARTQPLATVAAARAQQLTTQTLGRNKPKINKPPRKGKPGTSAAAGAAGEPGIGVVPLADKQRMFTQSYDQDRADHLYSAEPGLEPPSVPPPPPPLPFQPDPVDRAGQGAEPELTYDLPAERTAAWRELGRSVQHSERPGRDSVVSADYSQVSDEMITALRNQCDQVLASFRPRASASYDTLQHMARSQSVEQPGQELYARLNPLDQGLYQNAPPPPPPSSKPTNNLSPPAADSSPSLPSAKPGNSPPAPPSSKAANNLSPPPTKPVNSLSKPPATKHSDNASARRQSFASVAPGGGDSPKNPFSSSTDQQPSTPPGSQNTAQNTPDILTTTSGDSLYQNVPPRQQEASLDTVHNLLYQLEPGDPPGSPAVSGGTAGQETERHSPLAQKDSWDPGCRHFLVNNASYTMVDKGLMRKASQNLK